MRLPIGGAQGAACRPQGRCYCCCCCCQIGAGWRSASRRLQRCRRRRWTTAATASDLRRHRRRRWTVAVRCWRTFARSPSGRRWLPARAGAESSASNAQLFASSVTGEKNASVKAMDILLMISRMKAPVNGRSLCALRSVWGRDQSPRGFAKTPKKTLSARSTQRRSVVGRPRLGSLNRRFDACHSNRGCVNLNFAAAQRRPPPPAVSVRRAGVI